MRKLMMLMSFSFAPLLSGQDLQSDLDRMPPKHRSETLRKIGTIKPDKPLSAYQPDPVIKSPDFVPEADWIRPVKVRSKEKQGLTPPQKELKGTNAIIETERAKSHDLKPVMIIQTNRAIPTKQIKKIQDQHKLEKQ